ncbi:MAG: HNH endonuclease [Deltaproteobacteria bacterium]
MPELSDYLDISLTQAHSQWRVILGRPARPTATAFRQADFTPTETRLCLAAMLVVDHRRYGGATSQFAPSPVPELASLFERTPASILAKQANLDGTRPNGARHEVETAEALLGNTEQLTATYLVVIEAARAEDVTPDLLPDFLGAEASRTFDLLGQDELAGEDVEAAVEPQLRRLAGRMGGAADAITERLLLAAARVGQHRFAAAVLAAFAHSCGFCGMRPGPHLERRGLLVASHIKPWRVSTSRERLDPTNGIAACPSHDAAFDGGLLWVTDSYYISIADELGAASLANPGMRASFGRPPILSKLLVPVGSIPPDKRHLAWHHQYIANG